MFLRSLGLILTILSLCETPCFAAGEAHLAELQDLQNHQRQALEALDNRLEDLVNQVQDTSLLNTENFVLENTFSGFQKSLEETIQQKREYLARVRFVDQLTHQFITNFQGDVSSFLPGALKRMAYNEAGLGTGFAPENSSYLSFLTFLQMATKQLPEKIENPLVFLRGYLSWSTILKPKLPSKFLEERRYTGSERDTLNEKIPVEEPKQEAKNTEAEEEPTKAPVEEPYPEIPSSENTEPDYG